MDPPTDAGAPPPPPGMPPAPPGAPGVPPVGGEPPGPTVVVPTRRPWWHWAALGAVILAIGLVVFIVLLATRPPRSDSSLAVTSPSASASLTPLPTPALPSPTPSPTPTPAPTAKPTAKPKTPAPTPTPGPANTPAEQAAILYPPSGAECGGNGDYSSCPVTQGLIDAANAWRTNHGPSSPAPLCRCPVNYDSPTAQQDDTLLPAGYQGNPSKAAVQVQLNFAPSSHETMVVIFTRQADGTWLADDTYCDNPQNRLGSPGATSCIH